MYMRTMGFKKAKTEVKLNRKNLISKVPISLVNQIHQLANA